MQPKGVQPDDHTLNCNIIRPPNAAEAVKAHQGCRARAEQMLRDATTADERQLAQFWIDKS